MSIRIVVFVFILVMVSCTKDKVVPPLSDSILGTWKLNKIEVKITHPHQYPSIFEDSGEIGHISFLPNNSGHINFASKSFVFEEKISAHLEYEVLSKNELLLNRRFHRFNFKVLHISEHDLLLSSRNLEYRRSYYHHFREIIYKFHLVRDE